jgi:guanylate kinase
MTTVATASAQPATSKGVLLVVVGPSGVGKSTIARMLEERLRFTYIVSATTRPRKPGDEKGKTYDHITREEFLRRLDADAFLEYASVYDDFYATPKHPTLEHIAAGRDVMLDIDVQGALQVRYHYPDALLILIMPPDEATLLQRLVDRGRDKPEEIQRRFRSAKREVHMALGSKAFDHVVVNDVLDRAVTEMVQLVQAKKAQR